MTDAKLSEGMREALVAAVPWIFEHGHHVHPHCYRGSDDGCYCGLDEAKKIVEAAMESSASSPSQPGPSCTACGKEMKRAYVCNCGSSSGCTDSASSLPAQGDTPPGEQAGSWEEGYQCGLAAAEERIKELESPQHGSIGALWVCYHALKAIEWNHREGTAAAMCSYCSHQQHRGHDKDCMVGNGLRMLNESIAAGKELESNPVRWQLEHTFLHTLLNMLKNVADGHYTPDVAYSMLIRDFYDYRAKTAESLKDSQEK